jgi:hypothetical protein
MYFRRKVSGGRVYLQIAESRRVGGQVRQRVIATLGRLDELEASGQVERLVRSGARFAARAMVLTAARDDPTAVVRRIGPALVFERLWAETGCRAVIEALAHQRKHDFALARAIFLTVLHRLMGGGSDLAADRWRADYRITGVEALGLHHLYRAMAWLGEALPAAQQDGRTPFAPRCTKDSSRSGCSPIGAICSAGSTWCSWTPPVSTSRARVGRLSAATATARTIARTWPR